MTSNGIKIQKFSEGSPITDGIVKKSFGVYFITKRPSTKI